LEERIQEVSQEHGALRAKSEDMTADAEFELRRLRDAIDMVLAGMAVPGWIKGCEPFEDNDYLEGHDYRIGDYLIKVKSRVDRTPFKS
jgi:hypothetical protein